MPALWVSTCGLILYNLYTYYSDSIYIYDYICIIYTFVVAYSYIIPVKKETLSTLGNLGHIGTNHPICFDSISICVSLFWCCPNFNHLSWFYRVVSYLHFRWLKHIFLKKTCITHSAGSLNLLDSAKRLGSHEGDSEHAESDHGTYGGRTPRGMTSALWLISGADVMSPWIWPKSNWGENTEWVDDMAWWHDMANKNGDVD
jgi:hypothetical protein